MKKTISSIIFLLITALGFAQEKSTEKTQSTDKAFEYALSVKMGFSQIKINDYDAINGNLQEIDFLLSNQISKKLKVSYGFGYTVFYANAAFNSTDGALKTQSLRLPVNLLYSKNFANKATLITGIGVYGNYLLKSKIPGLFNEKNIGIGFGASGQTGVKINIFDDLDFALMIESQTDFSKTKKNEVNQKLTNTNLLTLNFIYKI